MTLLVYLCTFIYVLFIVSILTVCGEEQRLTVDVQCIYHPPSALQVPDPTVSNSDSALSAPDSDDGSSSEEEYRKEIVEERQVPQSRLAQVCA